MIEYLTPAQIEQMKPAGAFVAHVLSTLQQTTTVGTDLLDIDRAAHDMIASGARRRATSTTTRRSAARSSVT